MAIHASAAARTSLPALEISRMMHFTKKLDALIDLVEATTDALAATWDSTRVRSGGEDSEPTIQ